MSIPKNLYQSKGNSDTMAVVIPKELRDILKLNSGDELQAKVDAKNWLLIYRRKKFTTTKPI